MEIFIPQFFTEDNVNIFKNIYNLHKPSSVCLGVYEDFFSIYSFDYLLQFNDCNVDGFFFNNHYLTLEMQEFLSFWINDKFLIFTDDFEYYDPTIYKLANFRDFFFFLHCNFFYIAFISSYIKDNQFCLNLYIVSNYVFDLWNCTIPVYMYID